MRRTFLAIIVALIFYAVVDITIWQRIFETNKMFEYADQYHNGWFIMLIAEVCIGLIFLYKRIKEMIFYICSLILFAFNGTEDILYYILDGRNIPDTLPWLDDSLLILFKPVTREGLILGFIIWSFIWILIWIIIPKYMKDRNMIRKIKII